MTTEEMRIAIAESMGWQKRREPEGSANPYAWWHNETRYPSFEKAPYPPLTLDWMHEVEKVGQSKVRGFWTAYTAAIKVAGAPYIVHATAEQKAEAYLRTLNKWPQPKENGNENPIR